MARDHSCDGGRSRIDCHHGYVHRHQLNSAGENLWDGRRICEIPAGGERIIVALDDEPVVEVLERVFRDATPALLAVRSPNDRWGFAFRMVDRCRDGQVGETVEFAEGASIGMVVAATGAHTFEVPHGDAEPMRVLVA